MPSGFVMVCLGGPVAIVGVDGSVPVLEALLVPSVAAGGVGSGQASIGEACGDWGEHNAFGLGVCGDFGAGVVVASSGAELDSSESANAVGACSI